MHPHNLFHTGALLLLSLKTPAIGLLLDGVGHLTNRDEDKAETFISSFTSIFNSSDAPWDVWSPKLEYRDWGSDRVPAEFELV